MVPDVAATVIWLLSVQTPLYHSPLASASKVVPSLRPDLTGFARELKPGSVGEDADLH